jgi:hypothetical protein
MARKTLLYALDLSLYRSAFCGLCSAFSSIFLGDSPYLNGIARKGMPLPTSSIDLSTRFGLNLTPIGLYVAFKMSPLCRWCSLLIFNNGAQHFE